MKRTLKELYGVGILFFYFFKWPYFLGFPYLYMNGLYNILEVSREHKCAVFVPSSIGAFGTNTPHDNTPQDTIQRPNTMYGVTKVAGELLCDYYYKRFEVDTRGVRFPGIISNVTLPGGGNLL